MSLKAAKVSVSQGLDWTGAQRMLKTAAFLSAIFVVVTRKVKTTLHASIRSFSSADL